MTSQKRRTPSSFSQAVPVRMQPTSSPASSNHHCAPSAISSSSVNEGQAEITRFTVIFPEMMMICKVTSNHSLLKALSANVSQNLKNTLISHNTAHPMQWMITTISAKRSAMKKSTSWVGHTEQEQHSFTCADTPKPYAPQSSTA